MRQRCMTVVQEGSAWGTDRVEENGQEGEGELGGVKK